MKKYCKAKKLVRVALAVILTLALVPAAVPVSAYSDTFSTISAGGVHSIAIKNDGSLWSWGNNEWGQLGDGTVINKSTPVKIMDGVIAVSAGDFHSLAIKTDGTLWAWGEHRFAIDESPAIWGTPVKIMDGIIAASAGRLHSLVIKSNGSLWAWGYNDNGQLGDGTAVYKDKPVKIMDGVTAVSAGYYHSLAVKSDGTLWTWGDNRWGLLGNGKITTHDWSADKIIEDNDSLVPVKIMDNVKAAGAGLYHSVALKNDGSVWAWGQNYNGQAGNGTTTDKVPAPYKIMDGVAAVSAGGAHNLAIENDGALYGWGMSLYGQIGDQYVHGYSANPLKIIDGIMSVSPAPDIKPRGNVNGDGTVDLNDLVFLARHIAEIETITDPDLLDEADINGDGKINIADLIRLSRQLP